MNDIALNIFVFCGGHMYVLLLSKYQGVDPGAYFLLFWILNFYLAYMIFLFV